MGRTRLTVHFGPGLSGDLWAWKLNLAEATSGRVEVVWQTSALEPAGEQEHRFRARTLPDWWTELSAVLAQIQFEALPPSTNWTTVVDDAATLSVELRHDDRKSGFSVFYAPESWPAPPDPTREALQRVVALLDPIARSLHGA